MCYLAASVIAICLKIGNWKKICQNILFVHINQWSKEGFCLLHICDCFFLSFADWGKCFLTNQSDYFHLKKNGLYLVNMVLCVPRIVAFMARNIDTKNLLACLLSSVNSSTVEKKIKAQMLKYGLSCIKTDLSAFPYSHAQL